MTPFLIDPSSRATAWLKNHLKEQRLEVVNQQVSSIFTSLLPQLSLHPADQTVSKRPGTSYQILIHFPVFDHSNVLFFLMQLVETW